MYTDGSDVAFSVAGNVKGYFGSTDARIYVPLVGNWGGNPYLQMDNSSITVSNPAYSFQSNTNTGFYNPVSGSIGVSTNGVEKARFTTTGLGIGTTSPYAPLSVVGTGGVVAESFTATSTTVASTFNLASSTLYYGANLNSCNSGSNALTWSAGQFGCNTISGSGTVNTGALGSLGWYASAGTAISATGTNPLTVGSIIATSTATSTFSDVVQSNSGFYSPEIIVATSSTTNIPMVAAASSTSYVARIGASGITLNLTNILAGSVLRLTVCNPSNTTGGAITWTTSQYWIHWSGTSVPAQTTTANACDLWTFSATNGSSTPFVMGAQISY